MNSSIVSLPASIVDFLLPLNISIASLLESGVWSKIKSKGAPFPIRGHRSVRVSLVYSISKCSCNKMRIVVGWPALL